MLLSSFSACKLALLVPRRTCEWPASGLFELVHLRPAWLAPPTPAKLISTSSILPATTLILSWLSLASGPVHLEFACCFFGLFGARLAFG